MKNSKLKGRLFWRNSDLKTDDDPIVIFKVGLSPKIEVIEPNAMVLSTLNNNLLIQELFY